MEIFKPIPGFPDYQVSNYGRLKSFRRKPHGQLMKTSPHANRKYESVGIKDSNNIQRSIQVHRLVMMAFIGPPPTGQQVCHNDGNGRNNCLANLRYDTCKSNHHDRIKHGTSPRGENHGASKLTDREVISIAKSKDTVEELAKQFGIVAGTVSKIKRGARWGHITGLTCLPPKYRRLTISEREAISSDNRPQSQIAAQYGVTQSAISVVKKVHRQNRIGSSPGEHAI